MIISHKHKFIFIKPVKVAGTSLEVTLAKHCGREDIITPITKYSKFSDEEEYFHHVKNYEGYYNHMPPHMIKTKIGNEIWNNYFKFTIARNPWDQVVSRYFWRRPNRISVLDLLHEIKKNMFKPNRYLATLKECLHYLMFFNFGYFIRNYKSDLSNTRFYFDSNGNPICDFYIRYENLENDYQKVCNHIGIPYKKLPKLKSKHRKNKLHYSKYFNKEKQKMINNLSLKEITFFNYKFEE